MDSKHSNANSKHSQIRTIRKGFEAFECKFEQFERDSKHSNANSKHWKGIRTIRMHIRTIQKHIRTIRNGFEAFESIIQTIRTGFEVFECKFEIFERDSKLSNPNSNHSKGI